MIYHISLCLRSQIFLWYWTTCFQFIIEYHKMLQTFHNHCSTHPTPTVNLFFFFISSVLPFKEEYGWALHFHSQALLCYKTKWSLGVCSPYFTWEIKPSGEFLSGCFSLYFFLIYKTSICRINYWEWKIWKVDSIRWISNIHFSFYTWRYILQWQTICTTKELSYIA